MAMPKPHGTCFAEAKERQSARLKGLLPRHGDEVAGGQLIKRPHLIHAAEFFGGGVELLGNAFHGISPGDPVSDAGGAGLSW